MKTFIASLMVLSTGAAAAHAGETNVASYCQGDVTTLKTKYTSEHGTEASREQATAQTEATRIKALLSASQAYKELAANQASLDRAFFQKKLGELLETERKSFFKSTESEEHSVTVNGKGLIAIRSAKKTLNPKSEKECKDKARGDLKHVAADCKYDPGVMFDHVPLARCVSSMSASYKYRIESFCHEDALAITSEAKLEMDPLTLAILPGANDALAGNAWTEYLKKNLDPNCFVGSKPPSQTAEAGGPKRAPALAPNFSSQAANRGAVKVE